MSDLLKPTTEQNFAIEEAQKGQSFKVIAYAGTGKTTTLQMISDAMPERRGMYLAFNKAIAAEAQSKFHRNVDCRTFHSLAFRSVPRGVTDKLRLPRLSPSFIAKEYRLNPITLRRMMGGRYEKYVMMPSRLASLVSNAVSHFCSTSSQYPAPRHLHHLSKSFVLIAVINQEYCLNVLKFLPVFQPDQGYLD